MPLDNYRDIPITLDINGPKAMVIGGFAQPLALGSFKDLKSEHGVGAIINLIGGNGADSMVEAGMDAKYYTYGPKVTIRDWWETPSSEAKRTDPDVFDNVYEAVVSAQKAGLKPAVHCGSGDGRTGTTICSLKLRELLEKVYSENPELIGMTPTKSAKIQVVDFNDKGKIHLNAPVTPLVKEAIEYVRQFDTGQQGDVNHYSVETLNDIESLLGYEKHLRAQFTLRKDYVQAVTQSLLSNPDLDVNYSFEEAVTKGDAAIIRALVGSKHKDAINFNAQIVYKQDYRPLFEIAVDVLPADIIQVFLESKQVEQSIVDEAFDSVIRRGDASLAEVFLEKNESLELEGALKAATKSGKTELVKVLLESNRFEPEDVSEAFKLATKKGSPEMIKTFAENNALSRSQSIIQAPADEYKKIKDEAAEKLLPEKPEAEAVVTIKLGRN